jgi:cellulose 1,4-beta-cellobiosidase
MFKLLNKEISVTLDVSTLPCGTDASFYFSEMEADGGKQHGSNSAGAPYGTGYCDA